MITNEVRKKLVLRGYGILLVPLVLNYVITILLSYAGFSQISGTVMTIFLIIEIIALLYVLIVLWVPNKIAFVVMEPGTALVVGRFGAPIKECRNLVRTEKKEKKGLFGGLKFVGIPGIHSVLLGEIEEHYIIRGIVLEPRKKSIVDNVSMMERGYGGEALSLDTSDRQPLHIIYMLKAKVSSAEKFLFSVDKPIKITNQIIIGALRQRIREMTFEEVFTTGKTALSEVIWEEIKKEKEQDRIDSEYGLTLIDLVVMEVAPLDAKAVRADFIAKQEGKAAVSTADFKAQAMVTEAKGRKEAIEIIAEGEANARNKQISLVAKGMFYERTKLTESQVAIMIKFSPQEFEKKYGGILKDCFEKAMEAFKISSKAYFKFDSASGSNLTGDFFGLMLAAGLVKDSGLFSQNTATQPQPAPSTPKTEAEEKKEKKKERDEENETDEKKGKYDVLKNGAFSKRALEALKDFGLDPNEEMGKYESSDTEDFSEEAREAFISKGLHW